MQELGKILEEIDIKIAGSMGRKREGLLEARDIIRKHMNDGWILVDSNGLPDSNQHNFRFRVTVQYNFVYQNGKIISEDVVAYRYYSAPKPYRSERSDNHDGE